MSGSDQVPSIVISSFSSPTNLTGPAATYAPSCRTYDASRLFAPDESTTGTQPNSLVLAFQRATGIIQRARSADSIEHVQSRVLVSPRLPKDVCHYASEISNLTTETPISIEDSPRKTPMLTAKEHRVYLQCGLNVLEACSALLNSDKFCQVPILEHFVDVYPEEDAWSEYVRDYRNALEDGRDLPSRPADLTTLMSNFSQNVETLKVRFKEAHDYLTRHLEVPGSTSSL